MIGMLAVLWMMATRAADPKMWRFFATAPEGKRTSEQAADQPAEKAGDTLAQDTAVQNPAAQNLAVQKKSHQAEQPSDQAATSSDDGAQAGQAVAQAPEAGEKKEPAAKPTDEFRWETVDSSPADEGPLDEDAEERDGAKEQFQAVSDFEKVSAIDMPAYWRLMRWARTQTFAQMLKRAKRGGVDVVFTHFAQEPERHRGELVQLKLHLKRVIKFDGVGENSAGLKHVFEAWGVTDNDSRSNPYVVVFSEKPPQLPLGADIDEEATFVGYFLKDMSYEAYNVRRWAPLLVGRLRWRANEARTMLAEQRQDSRLFWPVMGIGLVALLVTIGGWAWRLRHPRKRPQPAPASLEHQAVEQWIEKAEQGELAGTPENGDGGSDSGRRAAGSALDWIDPHRHNESS